LALRAKRKKNTDEKYFAALEFDFFRVYHKFLLKI